MKTFTYKIKDDAGIHARPAGLLVKRAEKFESEIEVNLNGKTADAKRLFSLMSLGAAKGDEISGKISGGDEDAAEAELSSFFSENL